MTIEEAIKELKDASYSEARYGDKVNHRDEVMKRIEAFDIAIKALEQQPCEDCIRELIREFDNKHHALFADYMEGFNEHTISEIIDYMWDMHNLIEDIKYRLPNEEGDSE